MHHILSQMRAAFHDVVKEANVTADGLAKERVFHSSISFDI